MVPGWISPRQVRLLTEMRRAGLADLLPQVWALKARPDRTRHLQAYRHLPPLRWLDDGARAAIYQRSSHCAAELEYELGDRTTPLDSHPAYRHPHFCDGGPMAPSCVVVADVPIHRGCPILAWPPLVGETAPPTTSDTLCFRWGTTLLVVATAHGRV